MSREFIGRDGAGGLRVGLLTTYESYISIKDRCVVVILKWTLVF